MALIGTTGGQTWPPVNPPKKGEPVKSYDVVINGVRTTLKLTDASARARGLLEQEAPETKEAKPPANKAAKAPANKARAAGANKSGDAG